MNRQRVSGVARAQLPLKVRDLSQGGADVILAAPLEPGSVHEFMLDLSGEPFLAKARICRSQPMAKGAGHNVAIEFVEMKLKDVTRLQQYLAPRLPKHAS
jgi:hypothetical protein